MRIEPLSHKTLNQAINLANRVFPDQRKNLSENASIILTGSLYQNNLLYKFIFRFIMKITDVNYWIAVNEIDNKVIGITGLYCDIQDREKAYWLEYTCVDPDFRGQGIGGKLVDSAIEKAIRAGKKFLRLYTSNNSELFIAQILYEKKGFRIIAKENIKHFTFLNFVSYLKNIINGNHHNFKNEILINQSIFIYELELIEVNEK